MFGIKLICLRSELNVASFWICMDTTIRPSVLVVFNNFLLIDATDRSKIRSDRKSFFIALSLNPLSFFANTPFKCVFLWCFLKFKQWHWKNLNQKKKKVKNKFSRKKFCFNKPVFKGCQSEIKQVWWCSNRMNYIFW